MVEDDRRCGGRRGQQNQLGGLVFSSLFPMFSLEDPFLHRPLDLVPSRPRSGVVLSGSVCAPGVLYQVLIARVEISAENLLSIRVFTVVGWRYAAVPGIQCLLITLVLT